MQTQSPMEDETVADANAIPIEADAIADADAIATAAVADALVAATQANSGKNFRTQEPSESQMASDSSSSLGSSLSLMGWPNKRENIASSSRATPDPGR